MKQASRSVTNALTGRKIDQNNAYLLNGQYYHKNAIARLVAPGKAKINALPRVPHSRRPLTKSEIRRVRDYISYMRQYYG